eukprot:2576194-Pyramimonas_sp.AAC.1
MVRLEEGEKPEEVMQDVFAGCSLGCADGNADTACDPRGPADVGDLVRRGGKEVPHLKVWRIGRRRATSTTGSRRGRGLC